MNAYPRYRISDFRTSNWQKDRHQNDIKSLKRKLISFNMWSIIVMLKRQMSTEQIYKLSISPKWREPILQELLWLLICFQIQLKMLVITFKHLHGLGPGYLKDSLSLITYTCPSRTGRQGPID